jgi:hypothetical protein
MIETLSQKPIAEDGDDGRHKGKHPQSSAAVGASCYTPSLR